MIKYTNIDDAYKQMCKDLTVYGEKVRGTKELNNYCFQLSDLNNNIINIRDISKPYLLGEMLWYVTARNDIKFIQQFAGLWGRISDDGVTSNSAYGDILFRRHGFNQVEKIIDLLKHDKESRRAVLNLNVPNSNVIETKDEICTIALQFMIRNNKLDCTCIMRSNDIWYGLPYDLAFFTELQKYIARRLGVRYGTYTHFAVSLHVYEKDYENIKDVMNREAKTKIKINYDKLLENKDLLEEFIEGNTNPKNIIVTLAKNLKIITEEEL